MTNGIFNTLGFPKLIGGRISLKKQNKNTTTSLDISNNSKR